MNSEIIENVKMNIKNGLELFDKMAIERNIEIWRPINGYPMYEVSSLGNVRNVVTERILRQFINSNGYTIVNMCVNATFKTYNVHRLVAVAFILNPYNKQCVDHIDNNKSNNKVSNLRFATNKENQQNRTINRNSTSTIKGVSWHKVRQKWYAQIYVDNKKIHIGSYNTIEEATTARQNKAKELFGQYLNQCEK